MIGERYLLCRTGPYHISILAKAVLRIWQMETPGPSFSAKPIDLRRVFGTSATDAGVAIALEMSDSVGVLVVDAVSGMAHIAEDDFVELPLAFAFARRLFDAACRRGVDGAHPLRLRRQPTLPDSEASSDPL
jgi:hypothetical protein